MDIRRQVTMAANSVISSIQGDQVPVVGRRPRRTRVIGTILVAGLILGMLAVPVGSVSAELVVDPCLTCVSERTIGASAARHTALAAFYAAADEAAAVRFSDSGAAVLLAVGDELASPAAAATAARYSALAAFYAAGREISAGIPVARFSDSGVGAFLATRSEAGALADAARYSGLAAFYAVEDEAVAARFNDSGATVLLAAPTAAAADARYSALAAFYAAEYRPAAVAVRHNDSGVAVAFAVP